MWHLKCDVCGRECGYTWIKVIAIYAYSAIPENLSPRKTLNVCHTCWDKAKNALEAKDDLPHVESVIKPGIDD
jgi:hypothetical protein